MLGEPRTPTLTGRCSSRFAADVSFNESEIIFGGDVTKTSIAWFNAITPLDAQSCEGVSLVATGSYNIVCDEQRDSVSDSFFLLEKSVTLKLRVYSAPERVVGILIWVQGGVSRVFGE